MLAVLLSVVSIVIGYFLGTIPTGYLVARLRGVNIQEVGSGNIGATNVLRALGVLPAVIVVILDPLKGALATLIPSLLGANAWTIALTGLAAVLGNNFNILLRLRGGKGIAVGLGQQTGDQGRHPVDPILIAIMLGIAVRNSTGVAAVLRPGIKYAVHKLLPFAIILLGAKLDFFDVKRLSGQALIINVTCVAVALLLTVWLCNRAGVAQRLGLLIGIGTAICGGTAIAVAAPVIEADDEVFFIAAKADIRAVMGELRRLEVAYKRLIIAGGGNIGERLAAALESRYQVKGIENNRARADYLSQNLDKSIVLYGSASDKQLLIDENIEEVDIFCAVTNDDEANIMSSLLAKRLGALGTRHLELLLAQQVLDPDEVRLELAP